MKNVDKCSFMTKNIYIFFIFFIIISYCHYKKTQQVSTIIYYIFAYNRIDL